tara:strand:+ start:414 stop:602 length:189 start_codon:yes stop_codon:yes gene_type:complete
MSKEYWEDYKSMDKVTDFIAKEIGVDFHEIQFRKDVDGFHSCKSISPEELARIIIRYIDSIK